MSKQYLATNLMMRALTLNLESYERGRKSIDRFTLSQLEELVNRIQEFTKDAYLVPFEGNENERDTAMICYFQQPNIIRCRFCQATITSYDEAMKHLATHEQTRRHLVRTAPVIPNMFLDRSCIPRSTENLTKSVKKFLHMDVNLVTKKIRYDSEYATNNSNTSMMLSELTSVLKKRYPSARCYSFGSRVVGTASPHSDVDIFLDLQGELYDSYDRAKVTSAEEAIESVHEILQNTSGWVIDRICFNARVPLLCVLNTQYDMQCDLTFSNGLAHRNSLWLLYMFYLQPSSRWLVCYLKQWNMENCLNTYTISLMVVFFFQCSNLLPSVHYLQKDSIRAKFIDGWNTHFARPTLEELGYALCDESVSSLAQQFFAFYGMVDCTFSLETDVVCPFLGRLGVKKSMFHEATQDKIPSEMGLLWHYMTKHKSATEPKYHFAYNKPFVVQDPFELSHNVAKSVPVAKASKFVRLFELSAKF